MDRRTHPPKPPGRRARWFYPPAGEADRRGGTRGRDGAMPRRAMNFEPTEKSKKLQEQADRAVRRGPPAYIEQDGHSGDEQAQRRPAQENQNQANGQG